MSNIAVEQSQLSFGNRTVKVEHKGSACGQKRQQMMQRGHRMNYVGLTCESLDTVPHHSEVQALGGEKSPPWFFGRENATRNCGIGMTEEDYVVSRFDHTRDERSQNPLGPPVARWRDREVGPGYKEDLHDEARSTRTPCILCLEKLTGPQSLQLVGRGMVGHKVT